MFPATGHYPPISKETRMENQLSAALEQLERQPDNEYWQNKLAEADDFLHGDREAEYGLFTDYEEIEGYIFPPVDAREFTTAPHR